MNPVRMNKGVFSFFSIDSGIKWRNAPPIKAPAEKLTRTSNILLSVLSLRERVNTPTNAIRLIMRVERTMYNKIIVSFLGYSEGTSTFINLFLFSPSGKGFIKNEKVHIKF